MATLNRNSNDQLSLAPNAIGEGESMVRVRLYSGQDIFNTEVNRATLASATFGAISPDGDVIWAGNQSAASAFPLTQPFDLGSAGAAVAVTGGTGNHYLGGFNIPDGAGGFQALIGGNLYQQSAKATAAAPAPTLTIVATASALGLGILAKYNHAHDVILHPNSASGTTECRLMRLDRSGATPAKVDIATLTVDADWGADLNTVGDKLVVMRAASGSGDTAVPAAVLQYDITLTKTANVVTNAVLDSSISDANFETGFLTGLNFGFASIQFCDQDRRMLMSHWSAYTMLTCPTAGDVDGIQYRAVRASGYANPDLTPRIFKAPADETYRPQAYASATYIDYPNAFAEVEDLGSDVLGLRLPQAPPAELRYTFNDGVSPANITVVFGVDDTATGADDVLMAETRIIQHFFDELFYWSPHQGLAQTNAGAQKLAALMPKIAISGADRFWDAHEAGGTLSATWVAAGAQGSTYAAHYLITSNFDSEHNIPIHFIEEMRDGQHLHIQFGFTALTLAEILADPRNSYWHRDPVATDRSAIDLWFDVDTGQCVRIGVGIDYDHPAPVTPPPSGGGAGGDSGGDSLYDGMQGDSGQPG